MGEIVHSPRVAPIFLATSVVANVIVGDGLLDWLGDVTSRNALLPGG